MKLEDKSPSSYKQKKKEIDELSKICLEHDKIDPSLYSKYDVKRGLRDANGKGVLTGLTEVAEVRSYMIDDNEVVYIPGQLFYRGYNINDLVKGFIKEKRFGFEETSFLLIFGKLPTKEELAKFKDLLAYFRALPTNFVRDVIMKAPSKDVMNMMSRALLTMYSYDSQCDSTAVNVVLRQSMQLISIMPMLAVYSYHSYMHFKEDKSLVIHKPNPKLSAAEHFLYLLRDDSQYTKLEANTLDLCLVLHADHGGGNNSAFTTRVVTSTGTDTYSAISAAMASLKGPKHGGANIKVNEMMEDIKAHVKDWKDEDEVSAYLEKILKKKAFDRQGLIYGMGHAVYTISDPREILLKSFVEKLSAEKGTQEEFNLFEIVERKAPEVIAKSKTMERKNICPNVDFYSGFVYKMLGIPEQLFTPLFASARISGWSAHRLEELASGGKIIRPGYKNICDHKEYIPMRKRES